MPQYVDTVNQIMSEVAKAVVGKDQEIRLVMTAMLAGGHILIDDIPGVGKTTLAMAFSRTMGLKSSRVQFTPDVLPSDITGFFMYQEDKKKFVYHRGPVMSHLFLADEINRTSAKTQSALLEVMEEKRVTIDGKTIDVPQPFIVIATQNPVGSAGTQMLPESQLDRFMISLSMGYPSPEQEMRMVSERRLSDPLDQVVRISDDQQLIIMQQAVNEVYIHDAIYSYIVRLANQTREHEQIEYGISPRGTLALARMAKSLAFIHDRDYVLPEDVRDVFGPVASHRMIVHSRVRHQTNIKQEIIEGILAAVPAPKPASRKK